MLPAEVDGGDIQASGPGSSPVLHLDANKTYHSVITKWEGSEARNCDAPYICITVE